MAIDINQPLPAKTGEPRKSAKRGLNMEIRFGAPRISLNQRMVFTERLSLLLETGVSLVEALKTMELQTEEPLLAEIIGSLADIISEGKNFSAALAKHPEMFSDSY